MLTFIIIKRGLQCKAGRERFLKSLLSRSLGESESDPISVKKNSATIPTYRQQEENGEKQ